MRRVITSYSIHYTKLYEARHQFDARKAVEAEVALERAVEARVLGAALTASYNFV